MVRKQSRLTSLLQFAILLLAQPLHADYQAGLDAYAQGDYPRALREWQAVTEQPRGAVNPAIYAEAHYAVARLYWDGQGVARDYYVAREWLEKAAALGHAGAMAKLGFLYTDGLSVQQDFKQAFAWYDQAAKNGDVDGLYNLGIFYLNGWGTDADPVMARQYLATASALGDEGAEEALQRLMALEEPQAKAGKRESLMAPQSAVSEQTEITPAKAVAEPNAGIAPAQEQGVAADPGEEEPEPVLRAEPWILAQDPAHYTIQAIGLRSRATLDGLVDAHPELAPMAVYVVQRSTNPLHVLVQGVYPTVEQARAARDAFPRDINPPDAVWIRTFGKVQEVIRGEM